KMSISPQNLRQPSRQTATAGNKDDRAGNLRPAAIDPANGRQLSRFRKTPQRLPVISPIRVGLHLDRSELRRHGVARLRNEAPPAVNQARRSQATLTS